MRTRRLPLDLSHSRTLALIIALSTAFAAGAVLTPARASPATGNSYVVNNMADLPDPDPANPVCASQNGQCTLRAAVQDANFAGGVHTITVPAGVYVLTLDVPDDCFSSGTIGTLAYDLILTTTNCFVTGPQGGNIVGQDPLLGSLQNNGGSTQTRALLPGSPAIDTGAPAGCTDDLVLPLTTDQRGFGRPANGGIGPNCDIGAYELYPFGVFLPLVNR